MSARDELAGVLAAHRVNYHHRNVGPEPVTADNLRYTSCEGCDWLGGHRDEAGWEAHIADALLASPQFARLIAAAEARGAERALREAADALPAAAMRVGGMYERDCEDWLRDRAALTAEPVASEPGAGEGVGV